MIPDPHQVEGAVAAYNILKQNMIVYIAWEERTGKTLTAIMAAEMCNKNVEDVLILTKKGKPLEGWVDTLKAYRHSKNYEVINYHSCHKLDDNYDLVILDECHNYISSYPKKSAIHSRVAFKTKDVPIIYISATPHAQGEQLLYHQFKLSSWSPWAKYPNFYKWFEHYGSPYTIEIQGIPRRQYDRPKSDRIKKDVQHLFITKTRKEIGFKYEPEDEVHFIELGENTRYVYNKIINDKIYELSVGLLVCDTESKLRTSLHQIEGGTIKLGDEYNILPNTEKIDYILENFGDKKTNVIMYRYIKEREKLSKYFKQAELLQSTTNAEGVDLHKFDNLIIYSQDFSTAKHSQRRARQCNRNREKPIKVYYILVKNAISHQVYKAVSLNKRNFVDTVFEEKTI